MPPTLNYPGVYIEELPSGVHTITGVATSIAAFVGWAPRGPIDEATLVLSWSGYASQFGGLDYRSYLGYAVNQFFNNGGQQAYIVRLVSTLNSTGATTATPSACTITVTGGTLVFTAKSPGAWGNDYQIQISSSSNKIVSDFKVSVVYAPQGKVVDTAETFDNLSLSTVTAITSSIVNASTTGTPSAAPANGNYPLTGGLDGNAIGVPAAEAASVRITSLTFDPTVSPSKVTIVTGQLGAGTAGLTISAQNPGVWGNYYAVQFQPNASDYTRFSLAVLDIDPVTLAQTTVEQYPNLSLNPNDSQGRYAVNMINQQSSTITASNDATTPLTVTVAGPVPSPPPPSGTANVPLIAGNDGLVLGPPTTGSAQSPPSPGAFETALNADGSGTGGVHLLDTVPIFNLLCVPGEGIPSVINSLQGYCVGERAFLIVDSQPNDTFASLQNGPNNLMTEVNATNAAFYFPWVNVFDPQTNMTRPFPPSGFVAGLYAATDASRGVWKAPAGIDAGLTGDLGLAIPLTDLQNGVLNVQAINCLRNFPVYGDVVWGARTLRGNDQAGSQWKYVPIRRMALFLESSLYDGTQWVVFEPNDETLWGQIRLNIGAFLQGLFLQGAFQGTTPQRAYFVKCDADNNPQSSIDMGIVNILVGFAPLYPAEFVVIQIQQMAGQLQV